MTEPEKIKVNKPTGYLEVPIEGGVLPNGGADPIKTPIERRPLQLRPADPVKDPSSDLIEAASTVFRVLTDRIAFHEREAKRLREALAPFASHARQSAAPSAPSEQDTVEALLRIAQHLKAEDGQ